MIPNMPPAVYQVVYDKQNDRYYLGKVHDKFKLPDVLYGNIKSLAVRVWNTFIIGKVSTGILLTGESGSGKSLLAEVISNLAIEKGVPVVYITAIEVGPTLIDFLKSLNNVVVFMDEFGKCTAYKDQNKMLSFFSDTVNRRLYLITENSQWEVSNYIRNRPGRIRYHIDYKKIPKDIAIDYLKKNVSDLKFREEVYRLYATSRVFSFDHLQAICSEHARYPEDSVDELVRVLNLGVLSKPYLVKVEAIIINKTGERVPDDDISYNKNFDFDDAFDSYRGITVSAYLPETLFDPDQPTTGPFDRPQVRRDEEGKITHRLYSINPNLDKCTYRDEKYIFKDEYITAYIIRWRDNVLSGTEDIMFSPYE